MNKTEAMLIVLLVCSGARADGAGGRWASTDHVTFSGSVKVGSKFFLDVVVAADGSFQGSWEEYVCFNYPGAYGITIVSCQRATKSSAVSGQLDLAAGTGRIKLERLGETPLRFKLASGPARLDIELPRDWLKQGEPVLYEANLKPR